jgi:hypothetical protein
MVSSHKILTTLIPAYIMICFVMILHSCEKCDDSKGAVPSFAPIVSNITQTEAHISGLVFCATSVNIEYGIDATYGNKVSGGTFSFSWVSTVSHTQLTNLNPNTTYHYRGVARYRQKTTYSDDHIFTTLP